MNFERPSHRTRIGIDTFDLLIDLVITPDLSRWTRKDVDEYAQARRLGLINKTDHHRVQQARQRAVALVEAGDGPFAQDWSHWRVQPHWPLPVLPEDALDSPDGDLPNPGGRGLAHVDSPDDDIVPRARFQCSFTRLCSPAPDARG